MTGRRGVLPLALLIVAALVAGVAVALIRIGEEPGPTKAGPAPTKTVSPSPKKTPKTPSPTPTETATESPSPDATVTESPSPDGTATESPPGPGGRTPEDGPTPPLAETGGSSATWLLLGALFVGLSVLLGRLARRPA